MIAEEFSGDRGEAFYLGFLLRLVRWCLLVRRAGIWLRAC